jgi:alanyl-tRNA synthetase
MGKLVEQAAVTLRGQQLRCTETALAAGDASLRADVRVLAVQPLDSGAVLVVMDPCPFYARGGGQVGDQGTCSGAGVFACV